MNLKVYEKTRYQNIYRHKKNKNYVIMISKPVKTSIATINKEKIFRIEDAVNIRDNRKIRMQKGAEIKCSDKFDNLWKKYIYYCKYELKLAYNTIKQKEKLYNRYLEEKITKKVVKLTKEDMALFVDNLICSDKQKNHIIKELKAFFNYLIKEEVIITSPMINIKKYKVEKAEMKFLTPEQLKKLLTTLEQEIINNKNIEQKTKAYRIKILILITFSLGDRIGETRALTYNCFVKDLCLAKIMHSINYDSSSLNFLSNTKNYHSQREINVTEKLINEIDRYKTYLIEEVSLPVKDNDLIFFNYSTNRPYSDTTLRKQFYEFLEKAKVPKIRMYDLRHTYVATMMQEGKQLYHISERIGHSDYSTTVNQYGHLSNKVKKEIAEITDKYI